LCYELKHHSLQFIEEEPVPLKYKDLLIDCAYRADIIVENKLVVEIKSVDRIEPVHEAQLLTYLKLRCIKVGLLLNFNVKLLKDGIVRKIL
ncbi:MAG TPA: GxxExxY protein, partial [bacterium]